MIEMRPGDFHLVRRQIEDRRGFPVSRDGNARIVKKID
jgi:hypothetical protein